VWPHVPKSGGTSVRKALEAAVGAENVYLDYTASCDNPLSEAVIDPVGHRQRFEVDVLPKIAQSATLAYGHFAMEKYASLVGRACFVTMLRHPVARTISHRAYWLNTPTPARGHPIHDYVRNRQLSLIDFARLPVIRWYYSRTLFRAWDMNLFDYIGRSEHDMGHPDALREATGLDIKEFPRENVTGATASSEERASLEDILQDDIRFYEKWAARP
jgi:hypothetical protein